MDAFEAISLPDSSSPRIHKRFSVTQANCAIPLVRRIVQDIVREYSRLNELHRECRRYDAEGDLARAEEVRGQYALATDRLNALREELEEIGCELKDYSVGLVDFPARVDGRDLLLCWMLGEQRVAYWHDTDAGFTGRQPVSSDWA